MSEGLRPEPQVGPFSRFRTIALFLAIVAVGPYLFAWFTQEARPGGRAERGWRSLDHLHVEADALDFGQQPPQEAFSWTLPLTNRTDQSLEVLEFELGCLCTKVSPSAFAIAPGQTREIEVLLDLQPKDDQELTKRVREFAATIKPIFKGGWPRQDEWRLTGIVVNPYQIEPTYLNYRATLVSGVPFPSREVVVTARVSLKTLDVECEPPLGAVTIARKDRVTFALHFQPNEDMDIGRHELTLRMQGIREDGSKLPPAGLKVLAQILPDVEVFPSVVHLGALAAGETGRSNVVLRSRTGHAYELVSIECANNGVNVDEGHSRDEGRHYEVQCEADRTGACVSKVHFNVRSDADGELREIPLVVCYSGVQELVAAECPPLSTDIEAR